MDKAPVASQSGHLSPWRMIHQDTTPICPAYSYRGFGMANLPFGPREAHGTIADGSSWRNEELWVSFDIGMRKKGEVVGGLSTCFERRQRTDCKLY